MQNITLLLTSTYYSRSEMVNNNRTILLLDCSGLTTISRYPIKNWAFDVFDNQGGFCDWDFQYFGKKGMGIIQIEPIPNVTVFQ